MGNEINKPLERQVGDSMRWASRRQFLQSAILAAGAVASGGWFQINGQSDNKGAYKIIGFSKPFQKLSFEETADVVESVGWDGIECPVRKGGQVLPERVEEDLPKLVEALKKRNRELVLAATDVRNASDPLTERVLRTLSKLGVKLYRLAHARYNASEPIPAQLDAFRSEFRELGALNRELGLTALYQNHSGRDYLGAAVWDLHELLGGFDSQHYGVCFDIGHATVEGGLAWPTNYRLIQPWIKAIFLKDFAWKKTDQGWAADWCALGDGMVPRGFFDLLKKSSFRGPIVQHHEYPLGSGPEMVRLLKKDFETLRAWMHA